MAKVTSRAVHQQINEILSHHLLASRRDRTCGCGWDGPLAGYPAHLADEIRADLDPDGDKSTGSWPVDLHGFSTLVGITVQTLRTYRKDGRLPPPDGRIGKADWWYARTVHEWTRNRPGSRSTLP